MVLSRLESKGPGSMVTAEPEAPSSWHSTKGIVKMPKRFDDTVSNNAKAVLPPTVCMQQAGDWFQAALISPDQIA